MTHRTLLRPFLMASESHSRDAKRPKSRYENPRYDALRRNESSDAPASFLMASESHSRDAERPKSRYDAERRNELWRLTPTNRTP